MRAGTKQTKKKGELSPVEMLYLRQRAGFSGVIADEIQDMGTSYRLLKDGKQVGIISHEAANRLLAMRVGS